MTGAITMSGATVTGIPSPVASSDAVPLNYANSLIYNLPWKATVQVATTGSNITLSSLQTIDGYSTQANDRVLVKDQSTQTQNGIYIASSGSWVRATDSSTGAYLINEIVYVENGSTNTSTQWVNNNTGTITIGVTNITYIQTYSAGTGLTLTNNVFSITPSGVSAGTYGQVTVNTSGQTTGGTIISTVPYGGTGVATLTGIVKGNGASAFSAAVSGTDYAPATSGSSILYGNGSGGFSNVTVGSGLSFSGGTLVSTGSRW